MGMIVTPPAWYQTLYVGSCLACLILGLAAIFAPDRTIAVAFAFPFLLLALVMLLIAAMSLTRRLELRDDQLVSILFTGARQVAVSELGSMRISPRGNGLSRVEFLRRDGTAAFGRTRGTWPTVDLLRLADAMNISVQSA